jgi:hypothetical protein
VSFAVLNNRLGGRRHIRQAARLPGNLLSKAVKSFSLRTIVHARKRVSSDQEAPKRTGTECLAQQQVARNRLCTNAQQHLVPGLLRPVPSEHNRLAVLFRTEISMMR